MGTQKYINEQTGSDGKPVSFVFHGGSGSSREDIRYAIEAGTIKMNIDTDTQGAFWDGIREYESTNRPYLQGQIGNPEGEEKPNKKYYDPRMPLRSGEQAMSKRLVEAAEDQLHQGSWLSVRTRRQRNDRCFHLHEATSQVSDVGVASGEMVVRRWAVGCARGWPLQDHEEVGVYAQRPIRYAHTVCFVLYV